MFLIKNGRVIDPFQGIDKVLDILIDDNGNIKEIGSDLVADDFYNATGKIVSCALIDSHVHLREPGFTYKEDIISGSRAARRGGFGAIIAMANTMPICDNPEILAAIYDRAKTADVEVLQCAAATVGFMSNEVTSGRHLIEAGAVGFTDDGINISSAKMTLEAMEMAAKFDVPISLHEEDKSLIFNAGVNYGAVAEKIGLIGATSASEEVMVARDIALAMKTGAKTCFQHLSSGFTIELIRRAKLYADNLYAEVTPHHIALTEDAVLTYGTDAKMNPPLRTENDRQAIIKGIVDGTVDIIATDHAPHSESEKDNDFAKAPSGITGLETSFSVCYTNLVKAGHIDFMRLFSLMCANPAKLYKLDNREIVVGNKARLTIFDEEEIVYTDFLSKAENTPFKNEKLYGRVLASVIGTDFKKFIEV